MKRRLAMAHLALARMGGLGATLAARPGGSAATEAAGDQDPVALGHRLRFPRDHGTHLGTAIEWWYATGWLHSGDGVPRLGFQLTFFRSRTPQADAPASTLAGRFAPRHLLMAHAALTDLRHQDAGRHRHAQRLARWSGEPAQPEAHAARGDTRVQLGAWSLARRDGPAATPAAPLSLYECQIDARDAGFAWQMRLQATQPLLLQGEAGFSRKGPLPTQASHYYSQPQLAATVDLQVDGRRQRWQGTAWLDHEWSHALLAPEAVGWDWIGINLRDGGALTAFVLRAADGRVVWAGGSHRPAGGAVRAFGPQALQFTPQRHWTSPDTGAVYPVTWALNTPIGAFRLQALLDAQELDSRASTGTVYWEGLAELRDVQGRPVGLGYLEMTGRAGRLNLGG